MLLTLLKLWKVVVAEVAVAAVVELAVELVAAVAAAACASAWIAAAGVAAFAFAVVEDSGWIFQHWVLAKKTAAEGEELAVALVVAAAAAAAVAAVVPFLDCSVVAVAGYCSYSAVN